MAVLGENALEGVEHFGADAQGVGKGLGAHGHDHEFLDVQIVGSMRAAVDDVHHGRGHDLGVHAAEVLIQGQAEVFGGGAGRGERHAEHGVGAEAGLVFGAVEVDEGVVHLHLAQGVEADYGFGDFTVHVFHGAGHALALVAALVAVAQFEGFAAAGGGAGRNGGAADVAGLQSDFHFNGRIAAGVEDLAGPYGSDGAVVH